MAKLQMLYLDLPKSDLYWGNDNQARPVKRVTYVTDIDISESFVDMYLNIPSIVHVCRYVHRGAPYIFIII